MFVKEKSYDDLIHYLHLLSDSRSTCVFTFRMVEGRVTRSTLREAQKWILNLGILNGIISDNNGARAEAHEEEPSHA